MKRCPRCNEVKPLDQFFKNRARRDGVSGYCRVCQTAANDGRASELRSQVFEVLGGPRCVRCGYDDARALVIDHKNGGGTRHRVDAVSAWAIYRHALEHPDEYQVLCWNCNHIKRIEDGEHGNYAAGIALPERVVQPKRWARDYDSCTACSTTEVRHHSKGLCRNCFQRQYKRGTTEYADRTEAAHKAWEAKRRNPATTSSATT